MRGTIAPRPEAATDRIGNDGGVTDDTTSHRPAITVAVLPCPGEDDDGGMRDATTYHRPMITVAVLRDITGPALEALVARVRMEGASRVDARTAELMGLQLEPSTWRGRATHLKAICSFMARFGLEFPLHERDILAFMGYSYHLLLQREGARLSAPSMASYLSGIRLTHAALGLGLLPRARDSLWLMAALDGYKKAASSNLPVGLVRIALPVDVLYDILAFALRAGASTLDVRDGALVITAGVFGLRPAGAQGVRREHVRLSASRISILVGSLKGRTAEQARRRGERSFYAPPIVPSRPLTVLDLLTRWTELRGDSAGPWFSRPGLPRGSLDRAVRRLAEAVGYSPPSGCQISGHSMRILAFSQSALMLWSDVRLKIRFDWKNVADMADVYLDHRARTSSASAVFFCPDVPRRNRPDNSGSVADGAASGAASSDSQHGSADSVWVDGPGSDGSFDSACGGGEESS